MAVAQFNDLLYFKFFNTGEQERLGSFTVTSALDLAYIVLSLATVGTPAGAERLRLKLLPVAGHPVALATSEWRLLSAFGSNKLGRLRFDFAGECINPDIRYYVEIETDGYTRSASFYIAAKLDWPDNISTVRGLGAQFAVLGYR